jgi:thiol-disulfide isomerase/thioredoxin
MKQTLILFSTLIFANYTMAQQAKSFKVQQDPKHKEESMLVGAITADDIVESKVCAWYQKGFDNYTPDSNRVRDLMKSLGQYHFVVFAGTWCEDTQYLLPKFAKVMHACKVPDKDIEMYGVDRSKQALNVESLLYRVERVPTIIIINGPREIGRIVESLTQSNIETEILYLIEKDIEQQSN